MEHDKIHPEATRLYESLLPFTDKETAKYIAFDLELPRDSSPELRAAWVHRVIEELESRFDAPVIKKIRLGCYCDESEGPGKCKENGYLCADKALFDGVRAWLRDLYVSSGSLEEFVDKANSEKLGWYVENGELYTKFFECECPMLELVGELPSYTWCYCTAGYGKRLFEAVLGYAVDIEILQSIRQGHDFCLMKVVKAPATITGDKTFQE